tara:strand:- start:1132 stop:1545 length:414 start_codon:yes stop_codon:yes gene_type:complete
VYEPTPFKPRARSGTENSYRRVFVRDLILNCAIGIHAHEQNAPQRVRINLELIVCEDERNLLDRIENVVDYETIVDGVRAITKESHINLVETLAERIAGLCLIDSRVARVWVSVEKLDIYAEAQSVGVEIERARSDI